ncbi:hypothetical protein Pcinc_033615 [Petrolisthes cinctipes]|uniref:Uncharacterized protein n=1 Tax=Petrolisthes cinctipes TaxID=88211 RepID=A0AAE1ERX5_PETCI|nr:hypothetical protein Pcinc_033615 [Petrolisthes cinctipes]
MVGQEAASFFHQHRKSRVPSRVSNPPSFHLLFTPAAHEGVAAEVGEDEQPEAWFWFDDARLPPSVVPPRPAQSQPVRPFLLQQAYFRARQDRLRQQKGIEDDVETVCFCSFPPKSSPPPPGGA